jgi:hypothetical protein
MRPGSVCSETMSQVLRFACRKGLEGFKAKWKAKQEERWGGGGYFCKDYRHSATLRDATLCVIVAVLLINTQVREKCQAKCLESDGYPNQ